MKHLTTSSRLREALNDINMTQQELADKSHVAKASVSHYVNGSHEPSNKSAYMMGEILGVNPLWLMGLDVPKYTDPNEVDKAKELYEKYSQATPEIRAAVEVLLKVSQHES